MRLIGAFICKVVIAVLIVLAIVCCCIYLQVLGCTNVFYAQSFKEFKWPPYVGVRQQVDLEMLHGKEPTVLLENDWDYIKNINEPECNISGNKTILIIVKTAPDRSERKTAIRSSWGKSKKYGNFHIRTIFVMGNSAITNSENLKTEISYYNDLLIGDFKDDYYNNTLKFIRSIKFAHNNCKNVHFVLLVDDDYMVSIKNLVHEVQKHLPFEHLYTGWKFDSSAPRRNSDSHIRRISIFQISSIFGKWIFTGGAVLLSSKTVREFFFGIQHLKLYIFDDIYISIIAFELNIMPIHNEKFLYHKENTSTQVFDETVAAHGYDAKDLIVNNFRVND